MFTGIFFSRSHTGWFATKARFNIVAVNTADMRAHKIRKLGVRTHPFEGFYHTMLTEAL